MQKAESKKAFVCEYFVPFVKEVKEGKMSVSGVAATVCTSRNGVVYSEEELRNAVSTLAGKKLIKDHEAYVDNIVGIIDEGWFDENEKALKFRGKIMDEKIQGMVKDGRISSVSIGASCDDLVEEEVDGNSVRVAKGITIDEVSFVVSPGIPEARLTNIAEAFDFFSKVKENKGGTMAETDKVKEQGEDIQALKDEISKLKAENDALKQKMMDMQSAEQAKIDAEKAAEEAKKKSEEAKMEAEIVEKLNALSEELKKKDEAIKALTEKVEAKEKAVPKTQAVEEKVESKGDGLQREMTREGLAFWRMPDSKGNLKVK
jgi:hypothetical protein